jgi:hypothetical protein
MKKRALSFVALGVLIAVGWLLIKGPNKEQRQALVQREAATFVLGKFLASKYPAEKILIASNPFTQLSGRPREIYQFENAGIDGFKKGLGQKIAFKVVFPELRPGAAEHPETLYVDPQSKTPLSFLVSGDAFDKLFAANKEFHICATLIGLPSSLAGAESWQNPKLKYALLLPDWGLFGNPQAIRNAFRSEKIAAGVVNRPDAPAESKSAGLDYQRIFDEHFLLITAANCDELMNRYRKLF